MKGTSKVMMGATLVMVVSLAIVLGFVLVLLAELYCSLLLRRRQLRKTTSNTNSGAGTDPPPNDSSQPRQLQDQPTAPQPLRTFYSEGVLQAPRSFLFPAVVHGKENTVDLEKQNTQLPQFLLKSQTKEPAFTPQHTGIFSASPIGKVTLCGGSSSNGCSGGTCDGGIGGGEHLVYICNPIYENGGAGRPDRAANPLV